MKKQNREKEILGFNRNIFFTGLTSFLTDTSVKMVYSVMPMFLLSIGASRMTLSLIEGIAESTASLFKSFSGYWSDRIGKNKPFMLAGYGLSSLIFPLYALVTSPLQVLIFRFAERMGKGIRTAPRDSLIAGSAHKGESGKSFGLQKAMDNSGAIVGPLLAFFLLWLFHENYRLLFLIAAVPSFLGCFVIIWGIREAGKNRSERLVSFKWKDLPAKYYLFLGIIFVFTLGNSTDALLMVKAHESGVKIAFVPLVYMITSVISVLLAIPAGMVADKTGKEKLLVAGFMVYAIVYFGFGRTHNGVTIAFLFALYGLYSALTDGVQKALVSDMTDQNKKGTALGIYNALLGMTLLPASLIGGFLYDRVNSSVPFYFGSVTAFLSAILMFLFIRNNKPRPSGWGHREK